MTSLVRNRSPSRAEQEGATEDAGLLREDQETLRREDVEDAEGSGPSSTSTSTEEARRQWHGSLARWQGRAVILSHALSLVGALLVMFWGHQLGGLAWHSKQVFNWHPLLMVLAFCFMTVAALSFRAPYLNSANFSRSTVKCVHGSAWAVAAIFATIGIIAVFKSHNDGLIANLYSFHSWLGLGVVGLYVLQFLAGFFAFARPLSSVTPRTKAQVLSIHSFLGPFLHIAVAATILLGIQEKEGFIKCGYSVDKPDLFPLSHLTLISPACLVSHALGIVVFATALSTSFALHDFKRR